MATEQRLDASGTPPFISDLRLEVHSDGQPCVFIWAGMLYTFDA